MADGDEDGGSYLPLSVATAIAYGSVVDAARAARERALMDAHLNHIAAELAALLPVYWAGNGALERLPAERVSRGYFKEGGQALHLPDAPQPVTELRVRKADLQDAIDRLPPRLSFPSD